MDDDKEQALAVFQHAAEEIRFFKLQQWSISNYGLLVQAGIVGVYTTISDLRALEKLFLAGLSAATAITASFLLIELYLAIGKERSRMDEARSEHLDLMETIHSRHKSGRRGPLTPLVLSAATLLALAVVQWIIWRC